MVVDGKVKCALGQQVKGGVVSRLLCYDFLVY